MSMLGDNGGQLYIVENMSQVCNIRHKIRYDEAAAFGEQMSVCTSLGVTNVFYD